MIGEIKYKAASWKILFAPGEVLISLPTKTGTSFRLCSPLLIHRPVTGFLGSSGGRGAGRRRLSCCSRGYCQKKLAYSLVAIFDAVEQRQLMVSLDQLITNKKTLIDSDGAPNK